MKKFKVSIAFNTTSSKHLSLENKLECSCIEFCKGNFMSIIGKI